MIIHTKSILKFLLREAVGILLALIFIFTFSFVVYSADLQSVSDTLSDSDVNVVSNHTIQFSTPSGISNGSTTQITIPASFQGASAITHADVDVASTSDYTVGDSCAGSDEIGFSNTAGGGGSRLFTLTFCSGDGASMSASTTLTVDVGLNASFGSTSANQITNPTSTGSFEITIAGTMADNGSARVAIIDDVVVTAAVLDGISLTLSGIATSTDINGVTTTISTEGDTTILPFGNLPISGTVTIGQQLSVETNAQNGFTVTVEQDQNLQTAGGADIDLFVDGSATSTPSPWVSPSNSPSDENTWGHFGVTSEDDLNNNEFGTSSATFIGNFASPRAIFTHNGTGDGVTPNEGLTEVAYRIEIGSLQEAGSLYTNTLTYVITAVY